MRIEGEFLRTIAHAADHRTKSINTNFVKPSFFTEGDDKAADILFLGAIALGLYHFREIESRVITILGSFCPDLFLNCHLAFPL
ncbi:hypothetical protein SDC9_50534 [bioreactor metagenome]|uniref:Uncharacterized protein n=1 Tax=bioreactor metagenome TaxID=1076179 RepID=A0A644WKW3_9ZZZZ